MRVQTWQETLCWTLGTIFAAVLFIWIAAILSPGPPLQASVVAPPPSLVVAPPVTSSASAPEDLGYGTGLPTPEPVKVTISSLRAEVTYEHKRAEMYAQSLQLLLGGTLTPLN